MECTAMNASPISTTLQPVTEKKASSEVVEAIRCVMNGDVYASRKVTSKLLERMSQKRGSSELAGMERLTDREFEVFQMLGFGKSTREIAQTLILGESTVDTYRSRIKEKLKLQSAAELYLCAGQWVRDQGACPLDLVITLAAVVCGLTLHVFCRDRLFRTKYS